MKRITLNITDAQSKALKECAAETGVQQSEQVRRSINMTLYAETLQKKASE